ncbi:hypothetical protein DL98DRAFT_518421 [Cadophora sp. DSE1049]|nr:hypothetical protein DL98DRAFT_518421 [Cadophora sp. DSE1049]
MNLIVQIFSTTSALFIRALADFRAMLISQTGKPLCPWEPLPHEPNLYDSGLVTAALITWMLGIPFLATVACLTINSVTRQEAYFYWEYRTYKRWFTKSECLTPKEQVRMVKALCPDVEVRVRTPFSAIWENKDEGYNDV